MLGDVAGFCSKAALVHGGKLMKRHNQRFICDCHIDAQMRKTFCALGDQQRSDDDGGQPFKEMGLQDDDVGRQMP